MVILRGHSAGTTGLAPLCLILHQNQESMAWSKLSHVFHSPSSEPGSAAACSGGSCSLSEETSTTARFSTNKFLPIARPPPFFSLSMTSNTLKSTLTGNDHHTITVTSKTAVLVHPRFHSRRCAAAAEALDWLARWQIYAEQVDNGPPSSRNPNYANGKNCGRCKPPTRTTPPKNKLRQQRRGRRRTNVPARGSRSRLVLRASQSLSGPGRSESLRREQPLPVTSPTSEH